MNIESRLYIQTFKAITFNPFNFRPHCPSSIGSHVFDTDLRRKSKIEASWKTFPFHSYLLFLASNTFYFWIIAFQEFPFIYWQKRFFFSSKKMPPIFFSSSLQYCVRAFALENREEKRRIRWMMMLLYLYELWSISLSFYEQL